MVFIKDSEEFGVIRLKIEFRLLFYLFFIVRLLESLSPFHPQCIHPVNFIFTRLEYVCVHMNIHTYTTAYVQELGDS